MIILFEFGLMNAILTAILAVVVILITRIWRNPHLSHFLWLVVLLKMVTPPLVQLPVSIWFEWDGREVIPSDQGEMNITQLALPPEARQANSQGIGFVESPTVVEETPSPLSENKHTSARLVKSGRAKDIWPMFIGIVWLGGSLVFGLIAGKRIIQFHRQLKEADLAGEKVQRIGTSVAKKLGLKFVPKLRVTDAHLSPMVWPIGRPSTVVLPICLVDELAEEQLRTIVAHEYAHIARRDCLVRWLEVLCTILYWWNPFLWLARKEIRQAEEFCCDALVMASYPGCSQFFGESLLKVNDFLSGIPSSVPLLASEMRGAGQMKRRIEMIIKEKTPSRLSRTAQSVLFILALAILPLSAQEPQSELATSARNTVTPSIGGIVEGLKESERAIESMVVNCQIESSYKFTKPGSGPLGKDMIEDDAVSMTRSGSISWEVVRDGRGRMEAKCLRTNIPFSGSKKTKSEEFVSTFDGTQGQFLSIISTPAGVVVQRDQHPTESYMKIGPSPYDFTTEQLGKPISTLVSEKDSKIVGDEEWENQAVVVVEVAPVVVREDYIYKQNFWIDPQRNYLVVRRQSYVQRGEESPWALHYQIDTRQHKEIEPGIWLPGVVDSWNYHVTEEGQDFLTSREHIECSDWSVNKVIDTSRFELEPQSIDQIGVPIPPVTKSQKESKIPSESTEARPTEDSHPGFRKMLVNTVDSQGRAVPQTGIFVNIWPDGPYKTSKRNYSTDEKGQVTVLVPDSPRITRIWTQKAGYVPMFADWEPEYQPDGGLIPDEFTFALPNGTEVGGVVENDNGEPIEGAVVEVMLGNLIDAMGRRPVPSQWLAEVPGPGKNPCITDAEGRWNLNNVPEGDEVFVRVKLTHPEYISDTRWGSLQEEQSIHMNAFRDKSAIIKMHRGVVVTGTVTDPRGNPIPDALVIWGDDPYGQDGSQEVRTNADGKYQLQPLTSGPMQLTVVAPGWSPQSRSIDIQPSGSSENFRLEKGKVLRIRFVDENGSTVPNVSVGIQGWQGRKALYNCRHPNVIDTQIPISAASDGVFNWDWAPPDKVEYSFYAKGYQELSKAIKAGDEVQIVTLMKEK